MHVGAWTSIRRGIVLAAVAAFVSPGVFGGVEPTRSTGSRLHELTEEYWEELLRLNPVLATFHGDHRYDDRFTITIAPQHLATSLELASPRQQHIGGQNSD